MSTVFNIKKGDTLPLLSVVLTDGAGNELDVSGADSVSFRMRDMEAQQGVYKASGAADLVTDGTDGAVSFGFSAANTNEVGTFYGEFVIDWGSGDIQTVPNDNFLTIIVREIA